MSAKAYYASYWLSLKGADMQEAFFCDGWEYLRLLSLHYPNDPDIRTWWEFIIRRPIEFRQPTGVCLMSKEEELT